MKAQNFPAGELRKSMQFVEVINGQSCRTQKEISPTLQRIGGFTLIELMIVVVVVAILTAVALPSYQESVARGNRAEARAVLLRAAQWMERHYSENNRYDQFVNGDAVSTSSLVDVGSSLIKSPSEGAARYNLTIPTSTLKEQTFTLKMVRAGSAANDRCGDFTLTHLGVKGLENNATGTTVAECWK